LGKAPAWDDSQDRVEITFFAFVSLTVHKKGIFMKIATTMKAGIAALVLVSAAGCVSQKSVDEARAVADRAVQDAAAAKSAADAAAAAANQAKSTAAAAQSTANQALQAAQAGQACCDATNEKIDRMFKKSVSK
jgi:murein lipoprotein